VAVKREVPSLNVATVVVPDNEIGDNTQFISDEKPLVLIVDDNSDLRKYLGDSLRDEFAIIEGKDGNEGYLLAVEKIPDLVVSDVMMPGMDGNQLTEKLKTDERTCHVPVILLTARASTESRIEGLETGADDFITKPFDSDELLVRIRNLVSQRKKLREIFSREISLPTSNTDKILENRMPEIDRRFLQKATTVVRRHIKDDQFSVETFSEEMNLSRMQLHRKLKALINQPANEFIRNIRLNHAADLLSGSFGNVTQVAFEVGFNNLSWFTKCFQEKFGMLPSDFMKTPSSPKN
jgi:DNA-binding response OmpR family regulator